ncbi:FHA domain-containing protein [Diaminobutyricimonas aerilata]|uniref:FHA domain-containing protein n=1 Tax=Diaminobutyricimonas aerilata TaxID=1162967 RepID=A0A2M9CLE0_9MICO|nr:FHA domain-containing protein [Diaminobutyricimonas aerilata]PJJ72711.1 FHA domain-containing protein [Diaminobutyricimonas aerilata]
MSGPRSEHEPDLDDTVLRPAGAPDRGVGAPPDTDDTVLRARGAAADVDDTVLVRSTAPAPVVPAARPPAVAPPPAAPAAAYRLRIADEVVPVDGVVLIGRRPSPPRVPGPVPPRLVTVPSPTSEVSSTHVVIRPSGTTLVVTDLRSTNGTRLSTPGAPPRMMRPGESVVVTPGTVLDLGDGAAVEVLGRERLG